MARGGALVGGALGAAVLALSHPALGDLEINVPNVEEDVWQFELFGTRTFDSDRDKRNNQKRKIEIFYGFNSWWQSGIEVTVKKDSGGSLQYDATEWENIFQLTPHGKYWLDVGLLFAYEHPVGPSPDKAELGLLLQKDAGPLVIVANTIFSREIGQNSGKGIEFAYAVRARYPWKRELQFAVEAFGQPGRLTGFEPISGQEHMLGPFVLGAFNVAGIPGVFNYQAGYLFGLTRGSPSGTVKWTFEYEIPF